MANEIVIKSLPTNGTFKSFASGTFNPADDALNYIPDLTTVTQTITLTALAAAAARQSDKVDLGALRADRYAVFGSVNFTGETLASGEVVNYYWAPSTNGTDANGNIAGNSGLDGAAGDGDPGAITAAEFVKQCQVIGSLVISDDANVQGGLIGVFSPPTRWGQIVVFNNTSDPFEADATEPHVVLIPIAFEVQ